MQYRKDKKSNIDLSILGFGCMRLPSSMNKIDKGKTESLLMQAYDAGVNYFDTAYIYPGSEEVVGEILEKNGIREKIFLATKLPQSMCNSKEDFNKYFNLQKKRLRTNYIDYYLMHNISEFRQWEKLCELGIKEWIAEKKSKGEIRQIGFSYHGSQTDFFSVIDAYDWDFVQIQYNYINIHYQAGMEGLQYASKKGLPVFIMEPLLGGKLVDGLPEQAKEVMRRADFKSGPARWAFEWLWNQPEVTMVLSGMNEHVQVIENIKLADKAFAGMYQEKEEKVINDIIEAFNESYKIRCTGCNYCMPCPKGINIPACFLSYNTSYAMDWKTGIMQYMNVLGIISETPHFTSDCVQCGKCESRCPQGIKIRKELAAVRKRFEIPGIKVIVKIARRFMR